MPALETMLKRLLRIARAGAAGLTVTGLAALEVARPQATPCPIAAPAPVRRRAGGG
ncbi:hypothetical protein [Caulobacter sp. 17J80-11]|uniref:hypothetical protein n=1 Tax=Caulobacter sp. 17J80-11 TaxID=2763502 RepID=UPI0016534CE7|nr:hypothetical protein [Caulobacter sp. 17J80-11]MBC6980375.1 hypothetical protein [Caulobacter sp. 17J80-11]